MCVGGIDTPSPEHIDALGREAEEISVACTEMGRASLTELRRTVGNSPTLSLEWLEGNSNAGTELRFEGDGGLSGE